MKATSAILFLASAIVGTANACVTIVQEGPPIVAPSASNLQLSGALGSQATLTISGLQKGWNWSSGGLGSPKYCTGEWLNIVDGTKPWKKLVWGSTQQTTTWKAGYNLDLTAKKTASYNETSTFLACPPNHETFAPEMYVFLLTDASVALPTVTDDTLGEVNVASCVKTKLHIQPATDTTTR
ncbi:hypothetical protein M407DRAFT_28384 [Tulasnella calospora MUT 4182]|uniref:Uncharacterized protein n=1 Tax=Tulasnella calospora MUT 4182 TaxID=1051891 RepID=A0A0C3QC27_9AGAM|nr:hypothetical protein M407DRAFT_28384 [Tulasnella calospora MUT 4182]